MSKAMLTQTKIARVIARKMTHAFQVLSRDSVLSRIMARIRDQDPLGIDQLLEMLGEGEKDARTACPLRGVKMAGRTLKVAGPQQNFVRHAGKPWCKLLWHYRSTFIEITDELSMISGVYMRYVTRKSNVRVK